MLESQEFTSIMSFETLPYELVLNIFSYLGVGDLQAVSCVCRLWREVAAGPLARRVTVIITDDGTPAIETLTATTVPYHNWIFKSCDVCCEGGGGLGELWRQVAGSVWSLELSTDCHLSPRDLVALLRPCVALHSLSLLSLPHLFMSGTLLNNPEDQALLSKSLANVQHLHLSCSHYITDALFSRLTSVLGPLKHLSFTDCQISFQRSLHKRFYPHDTEHAVPSDLVFTFAHILKYIKANAHTLKKLSFGRTYIDNESLHHLATVPGLQLESLHLMSCEQLSKSGVQLLCENQASLTQLDLSLCSRVTDYAIMAIAYHLPHLKILNLRRCQGITEYGIRSLALLRHLEELNISDLQSVTSASVVVALGGGSDGTRTGSSDGFDAADGDIIERANGYNRNDGDGKENEALGSNGNNMVRSSLQVLNLASLLLDWQAVALIPSLTPSLTHLDLSMCVTGVNDKSLQAVCKSLKRLRILNLNGCSAVSDIGLAGHGLGQREPSVISTGLSLETLGLKEKDPLKVNLGSRAERTIREEAEVKMYLEANMDQIVESSEYGLSNLSGLRELNLCGCLKVTDITLTHSFNLTELRYLNLSHCQGISAQGLEAMSRSCPSLEVLMLQEVSNTIDQVILVMVHFLKRIKTLDLQKCVKLTDDALDILGGCRTLRYLDVSGCHRLTMGSVRKVQDRIPLLNLYHRDIQEVGEELYGEGEAVHPLAMPCIPPPPLPLLSMLWRRGRRW